MVDQVAKIAGVLGIDTTSFKTGLAEANRELRVLESGFRASAAGLQDWASDASGLEMRIKSLTSQIEIQKSKVEACRAEYARLAAENGEGSKQAQIAEIAFNKEAERLGKMTVELDKTDTALADLKTGNIAAGKSADEMGEKQASLGQMLKGSWTEINSAIGVVKQGYQILKGVVDETIGTFVTYAGQVRELSQLNNKTAEENSRLIQLTDDYKISVADLLLTQKELLTQGKLLSIETLADIADKYNAATNQVDKNKIASDSLGKSWKSYIELLQQGSTAIRDQSAAISGELILTDASLRKARELEKAQDDLHDSWYGLKLVIGEMAAPMLINAANTATLRMEAKKLGVNIMENFFQYKSYADLLEDVTAAQKAAAEAEEKAANADRERSTSLYEVNTETQSAISYTDIFTGSILESTTALQQEQAEFGFIIGFAQQYETNIKNVQTAEENLQTAEDNLHALQAAKWPETSQKVVDAQEKVDGLKAKLGEAQQASLDATNEMIAGFLQAQLTMDGTFTEEDIAKVLNYRLEMGLLSDEAYKAALDALKIAENLASIPTDIHVDVKTDYWEEYHAGPGPNRPKAEPRASGGSIFPNSYLWNESLATRPEVYVGGGGYVLTKQDALAALGAIPLGFEMPNLQDQMAAVIRALAGSFEVAMNSRTGALAAAGAGMVNSNNSSRVYNIVNAGIDAEELERIQRRQEMLYGN
jgi:chaperonin cofactor prefoldin